MENVGNKSNLKVGAIITIICDTWELQGGTKYKLVRIGKSSNGYTIYVFTLAKQGETTEFDIYATDLENNWE